MKKRMLAVAISCLCLSMALMFGCSPSQNSDADTQGDTSMAQTGEEVSGDVDGGKALLQQRCNVCHTWPEAESFSPMTIDEAKEFLATHEGGLFDEGEIEDVIAYLQS